MAPETGGSFQDEVESTKEALQRVRQEAAEYKTKHPDEAGRYDALSSEYQRLLDFRGPLDRQRLDEVLGELRNLTLFRLEEREDELGRKLRRLLRKEVK